MKSSHKTLFSIPARAPLKHNCITDCITLSGFNSLPAAYMFETKTRAYVGLAASSHGLCDSAHPLMVPSME